MAQRRQRNRLPRNLVIGLLILIILYSLAGFLILPWWLKRSLPDQLEQRMGWQADVGDISSNPFALSLEARNLSANDSHNEKVIGLDRLYLNLSFFELLQGVIGFEAIELEEPFIRLDLLDDYSVNLARDWQQANAGNEQEPDESAKAQDDQALPALYLKQLAISGGELLFRDFSQPDKVEFRITPLDLTLSNLATWQRDDASDYHLQAAAGDQTLEWQGNLSVAPLYSSGSLAISDVSHETLGHFLAPYVPYDLRGGKVTVHSDYELQAGDIQYLVTDNGRLEIDDLAVALDTQSEEPGLTTKSVDIDDVSFDLNAREAHIGPVSLQEPDIALARNKAGDIDWMATLASGEDQKPASRKAETTSDERPFRWSLAGINVSDGRVHWRDQLPSTPADLMLEPLSLSIGNIRSKMDDPVTYELETDLESGGKVSVNGQFTPQPLTLEAAVSGSGVVLAAFEPYLQESANLAITDGTLGLDGNLDLDGQQEPLTGTFSGTAEVAGLNLQLPGRNEPLVSWQALRLEPIEYSVSPARLEIGTLTLAQPEINLVRNTDNAVNVEQVMPGSGAGEAPGSQQQAGNEDAPFVFRIGQLVLEKGAVDYTDRTLKPAFTTSLDQLNGTVVGLSNVSPQQGKVSVTGRIGGNAKVDFDGTVGTLGTEETSDLKLTVEDLSLPALSPYFGRYLGYGVDSGKLDLDLDYEITGSEIEATNKVIMDRLGLGQAIASQQAVKAPVKLGLALLTDSHGVIEVDLPVSGDLDNPEFSVGQVVMRAFVNLLAKAATSPFSVLGSVAELAGLSGEELGQASFEPGTARLAQGEAKKLAALADALHDRPDLLLNIRGSVSPSTDGLALLRDELTAGQSETLSEQDWQEARDAYLAGDRSLAPEALSNLARARGVTLQELLRDTHDVPSDQLFMLDPSRNAEEADDGSVIVGFTLDTR